MEDRAGFSSRHLFIFLLIAFLLATTVAAVALDPIQLLTTNSTTSSTTSSPSGMEFITSNGPQELTLLRGCTSGQVIKLESGGDWACSEDLTTAVSGAGAVVLDLADNGVNESAVLAEIATTGDTNSIFSEPTADKLLITLSNDWPKSDTADALAADPSDCAANNFAISIVANGNLTCAQVAFTDLSGAATDAQVPNSITIDLAALATALAANGANCSAGSAPLGVDASGAAESCFDVEEEGQILTTTVTGAAVDDSLLTGNGAGTATWRALVDCVDSGGNHLNYTAATNAFSCGTSGGASGYTTIQEEGANLTARAILNFIGATITCVDNAGDTRTDCTITAGGSTNSFETWSTPDGTAPVADSATDTVTFLQGASISIIGNAAADSITIGVTGSVAKADAFSANPADCATDRYAIAIGTTGSLTCTQVAFSQLSGAATDAQVPDTITIDLAATATALAANGANCSANNAPLGVDASGAVESCFAVLTTGGRSLTVSGTDVAADVELFTHVKSFTILNPTTGETNKVHFYLPTASTVTRIACSLDAGVVTVQFDERAEATPNTAGTDIMSSTLTCTTTTATTTSFSNASIAARVPVNLQITAAGTATAVRFHFEYTADD